MLTATDNGNSGDTFRIKIWDKNNGDAVVYPCQIAQQDGLSASAKPIVFPAGLGGWMDEAQPYLERIFITKPEFKTRGLEFMRNLLYSTDNVEMVLEDLRKAGLELVG
jgi:hypothetical protein